MAGVDGSLVMVGEAVTTEAEELDMPQKKEIYVLLENVPQVMLTSCVPLRCATFKWSAASLL